MKKFPRFKRGACAIIAALLPYIAAAGGEPPPPTPIHAGMTSVQPPVPYRAQYSVITSGTTVAEATYTLARSGQGWEFRAHARPTRIVSWFVSAEIDEYCLLETREAAVRPLKYRFEQKGDDEKDNKIWEAQYDWDGNIVTLSQDKKTRQLPLDTPVYDPLSVQLALAQCLKTDCREAYYSVLDALELQQRRFERAGEESLPTALGNYQTVKLSYRRGKRETITWLAPALNYIPVRIQQFRNSDLKSEMRITDVKFE
jgi:hypothetical protein